MVLMRHVSALDAQPWTWFRRRQDSIQFRKERNRLIGKDESRRYVRGRMGELSTPEFRCPEVNRKVPLAGRGDAKI